MRNETASVTRPTVSRGLSRQSAVSSALNAVTQGDYRLILNLLRKGEVEVNGDLRGTRMLCEASKLGYVQVVELLLQNGADFSLCDCLHESPMDLAMRYGHVPCIQSLHTAGAPLQPSLRLFHTIPESKQAAVLSYLRSEVFPPLHWRESQGLCYLSKHHKLRLPKGLIRAVCQYLT